jgi:cation:H+ antiporter
MLATLVMLLIGATAFVLRKRRGREHLRVDAAHASRDMSFFLVLYSIALGLALLPPDLHFLKGIVGWIFLPAYFLYLFLVLRTKKVTPEDVEEQKEEHEAFDELTFATQLRRLGLAIVPTRPPLWLVLVQTIVVVRRDPRRGTVLRDVRRGLLARDAVQHLLVALVLAPLATELPEAANSLLWTKDGKDVIALGNVAGAMVLPIDDPGHDRRAAHTLGARALRHRRRRVRAALRPADLDPAAPARARQLPPLSSLMLGGSLYVIFLIYVVWSVIAGLPA